MTAGGLAAMVLGACLPALAASPRVDYMLNCMGCHLADGTGAPGKVPSFRADLGKLLRAPGGRAFLVQVPGSAHAPLTDERLAGVLNWIVTNLGAQAAVGFERYTATEVSAYRDRPLLDVPARRAELLNAVERAPPADSGGIQP